MKKSIILSLSALALVGCSHNEYEGSDLQGGKLIVTASVDELNTRANGIKWDANDQIGIFSNNNHDNILFSTEKGDGVFTSETPAYILGDGEKNFTAYYPYHENVSSDNGTISFTTPLDFMHASGKASRENPTLSLVFSHKMTKISLTINNTSSSRAEDVENPTIFLDNVHVEGTFDALEGTAAPTSKKGKTETKEVEFGSTVEFILPPQGKSINNATNDATVTINYAGKSYSGSINAFDDFENGNQYNFTIDLTGDNENVDMTISSATITDWKKTDCGTIVVEEVETPKEDNVLEVGDFILKDGTVIDKNDRDFAELKSQVAGVVFYVGNPQPSGLYGYKAAQDILRSDYPDAVNGLAIAINNATDAPARLASAKYAYNTWFSDNAEGVAANYINYGLNLTAPGVRMVGYNNTMIVEKCAELLDGGETTVTGVEDFINALSAFNTANKVTGASSWYLPSYAELNEVYTNYAAVKKSVEKAGGSLDAYSDFATTKTETFYWTSDFRGNSYNWVHPLVETEENLYLGRNSNGTKGFFRLTIAF